MNEKNNIPVNDSPEAAAAVKKPSRRLFVVLISLLTALSLLTAAFAVLTFVDFSKDGNDGTTGGAGSTNTVFNYFDAPYADYIALTESMLKGLTLPGYDSRVDEVTDENVAKYINRILLNAVALTEDQITQKSYSANVKWSEAIDYADDVFLYIVRVEKDGKRVAPDYFENAYMEPGRVQIGMEYFGKSFDQALTGLIPMNVGSYEKRTRGEVKATDVILISYTATETVKATEEGKEDTVKNHKNYEGMRLDLNTVEDAAWRDALLANYGTVGQYFSFEYEEDVNEDGTKEKLKYEGVIEAVVENEETYPLVATLPENFFGENPEDETLAALNGAELTFHIVIDHMVPHEANTVDTLTKADIDTINAYLSEGGALTFTPSNDKDGKGELSTLTTQKSTLEAEKKKLEGEIETLQKGDITKLTAEIAALEEEIAEMEAEGSGASAQDITAKKTALTTKTKTLEAKQKTLGEKQTALEAKKAKLAEIEPALASAEETARKDCRDFFEKELQDSYAETVKMTAGQLVYDHLVKTLTFIKLPESEIEAMEEKAKSSVEYYYSQLTATQKRNYRDIEEFAAVYFNYDEKDYNGYIHYIESYLAPYEIKTQLLLPLIYNTFINDESKLNAKIDAHVADLIEITAAEGTPMTRDEILKNYETNAGKDYLRNYYAMPLVVYDYLADNNNVDFTLREIESK